MFYVQPRTEEQQDKAESRLLKRQDQRKRKLEEAGIKYDFEAVAYVSLLPRRFFSTRASATEPTANSPCRKRSLRRLRHRACHG